LLLALPPYPLAARVLLVVLAVAVVVLAVVSECRDAGVLVALPTFYLLAVFAVWSLDDQAALPSPDYWAALLVGLSAAAFGLGLTPLAVVAGLAALAFRELALPYCLACTTVALLEGRRREALGWVIGLVLFAAYLTFHIVQVRQRWIPADATGPASDWLRVGGFRLVLATARMNPLLLDTPGWVIALLLAGSLLGLASWPTAQGRRLALAVAAYVLAFSIVGNPYNHYWGLIYATLLPYGLGRAPFALRDLLCAAQRPSTALP
jgi:hypothetical protein